MKSKGSPSRRLDSRGNLMGAVEKLRQSGAGRAARPVEIPGRQGTAPVPRSLRQQHLIHNLPSARQACPRRATGPIAALAPVRARRPPHRRSRSRSRAHGIDSGGGHAFGARSRSRKCNRLSPRKHANRLTSRGNHPGTMEIRIVNVPPGEAPEAIRAAWVGLILPLAPGETGPRNFVGFGVRTGPRGRLGQIWRLLMGQYTRGLQYVVLVDAALDALNEASPDAAA
jgi:hypothetical protein